MTPPLRVLVDCRISPGKSGGVESYLAGLLSGLAATAEPGVRIGFYTPREAEPFVRASAGAGAEIVASDHREQRSDGLWGKIAREARRAGDDLAAARARAGVRGGWSAPKPLRPNAAVERWRPDVVHFPTQAGFLTSAPSLYQPHDLQHLHLPELFAPEERAAREALYRPMCDRARIVVAVSSWVADDVARAYSVARDRIRVVEYAPPTERYEALTEARASALRTRLALPARFAIYPAQTWPHKNHITLLHALAQLRDEGLDVPLVCTGRRNEFFPTIDAEIGRLDLRERVRFLDFVPPDELVEIYRSARLTVVPSRFEAASFCIWESFHLGVPVACSNVTSLPKQLDGCGLLFEPMDVRAMADAIRRLWTDEQLRARCIEGGRRSVARFTWERTARKFRAIYRLTAGRPPTAADRALLDAEAML